MFKLETTRLILRDMQPSDEPAFVAISQESKYQRFYSESDCDPDEYRQPVGSNSGAYSDVRVITSIFSAPPPPHYRPKQAVQLTPFIAPYGAPMAVVSFARCGGLSGTDGATHFSSLLCSHLPYLPPAGPFLCVGSHPAPVFHLTNL
jgi:hypothetical protein